MHSFSSQTLWGFKYLFDTNRKDRPSVAGVFCLGSFATSVAAVASYALMSGAMSTMGGDATAAAAAAAVTTSGDGWKVAAALAAKNVGGGLNYVAVASTLGVSPAAFAAGITADNFFALVYFPVVSWLGGPPREEEHVMKLEGDSTGGAVKATKEATKDDEVLQVKDGAPEPPEASSSTPAPPPSVGDMILALALSCGMVTVARHVAPPSLGTLPTATALAVAFATLAPTTTTSTSSLATAGDSLGNVLLFLFFATAGAAGGPVSAVFSYPALFGFLSVLYLVHLGVMLLVGQKVMGYELPEVLVASNANVGGPATAGALASGKRWTALIVPGMLIGNFGNAIGTFVGLGLGKLFVYYSGLMISS